METVAKRLYEGMFLVDSAQAAADWEGTLSVINTILQRADAEVVSMRKWQERKLCYEIDHKSRGTYILCYFNAAGERIAGIEKDVLLSEKVMRVLVLTTEKRPAEMLQADITGEPVEKPAEDAPAATEAAPSDKPAPAADEKPAADAPAEAPVAEEPAAASDVPATEESATSGEAPAQEPAAGDPEPAAETEETEKPAE